MTTRSLTAVLTAALLLTISGCSTTDPTPATSTTAATTETTEASPTPTLTQQEISIQEVKDTYIAYIAANDVADQAGYTPETLTPVLAFLTADGQERLTLVPALNRMAEQGISMSGTTVIGSLTATSYTPGTPSDLHPDTGATITITACVDPTAKTVYVNGEAADVTGLTAGCNSVTFVNQGEWLIDSSEATTEEYH